MDTNFCQQIDQESLVEQYVAGKLRGELLDKFEQHIKECEDHAQAVLLEKALKRGVSEFARSEIKTRLHKRLKKREDTRFMMLRYAAVLLVAVITPLILYYQFNVAPEDMADSVIQIEDEAVDKNSKKIPEEEDQSEDLPVKELKSEKPASPRSQERPSQPVTPTAGISLRESGEGTKSADDETPINTKPARLAEQAEAEDLLKSAEPASVPKIEADYPPADEKTARKSKSERSAAFMSTQNVAQTDRNAELNAKILQDSIAIRRCLDTYLSEGEKETFKIDLSIHIQLSGMIEKVEVVKSTHKSVDLEACLIEIIKNWIFTKSERDQLLTVQITY